MFPSRMDLQLQKWHYRSLEAVKKFEPETECIWQAGSKDGRQLDELCCDSPVFQRWRNYPFFRSRQRQPKFNAMGLIFIRRGSVERLWARRVGQARLEVSPADLPPPPPFHGEHIWNSNVRMWNTDSNSYGVTAQHTICTSHAPASQVMKPL